MPLIPYPNVPNVSGVPQVLRNLPAGPPSVLGAAVGAAQLVRSFLSKPVWGIFRTQDKAVTTVHGKPIVVPDSIIEFGYQKETSITSAPTQQGAFTDYNRVANPFETHLRMTKGGTEKERTTFIKQIDDLDTIQLYDIFTPEKVYLKVNFTRFELTRRGAQGAYWLAEVDLYFREIRTVTSQYTTTMIDQPQDPSSTNVQNDGVQQVGTIDVPVPTLSVSQ